MPGIYFIKKMFTKFEQIYAELKGRGNRKRMVAAWGVDTHTVAAAGKAVAHSGLSGAGAADSGAAGCKNRPAALPAGA